MNPGVVFVSTGGEKMVRALRSLRRVEPDLPVHIVMDLSSRTWGKNSQSPALSWFEAQPSTLVRGVTNTAYINGALNAGMRWMEELGHSHGCLFHDDVIFSPLHPLQLTNLFKENFPPASALTFSLLQAFVPKVWQRPAAEWDAIDLESQDVWQKLLGEPKYWTEAEGVPEIHPKDWTFFVQYHCVNRPLTWPRLGPTGQIVPMNTWHEVGCFDETCGIFYDIQYPAECRRRGLPPIYIIPSVPHLHLHNQTIGYADPALGIWANTMKAFSNLYGDYHEFWKDFKCES